MAVRSMVPVRNCAMRPVPPARLPHQWRRHSVMCAACAWELFSSRSPAMIVAAVRVSLGTVLMLATIALFGSRPAYAADTLPYRVDMASTGDGTLDVTLKATSELLTLRSSAPVGPFGLIG